MIAACAFSIIIERDADDKRPSLQRINLDSHLSGVFFYSCSLSRLEVHCNAKLYNLGIILNHFIILLINSPSAKFLSLFLLFFFISDLRSEIFFVSDNYHGTKNLLTRLLSNEKRFSSVIFAERIESLKLLLIHLHLNVI